MLSKQTSTVTVRNQDNAPSSAVVFRINGITCGRTKRRFIVWSLLLLQLFFISCFWFIQVDVPRMKIKEVNQNDSCKRILQNRVHFITNVSLITLSTKKKLNRQHREVTIFNEDFFLSQRINESETINVIINDSTKWKRKWCFREGTSNDTQIKKSNSEEEDYKSQPTCKCLAEWHGIDCGQPEVIWRTLMCAKRSASLMLQKPSTENSHRLVYMLNGYFFSLDLLELQIKTVINCVDYFVINIAHGNIPQNHIKAINKRLKDNLRADQFIIHHCGKLITYGYLNKTLPFRTCSPKQAYTAFKWTLLNGGITKMKPTDIFIYTHDYEILNRKALKFIRYYYNTNLFSNRAPSVMQFRLKYVVYGFYWQHPKLTRISGVLSSFATLDNPASANGDPEKLINNINVPPQRPKIVIGDLNQFGGWFCQYCQQPNEIIYTLQAAKFVEGQNLHILFPNSIRNKEVNLDYLQKLIAQGQCIDDSKLVLKKLRRYSEKYYAPEYAEQHSGQFDYLLLNLYEFLESGNDNDDE